MVTGRHGVTVRRHTGGSESCVFVVLAVLWSMDGVIRSAGMESARLSVGKPRLGAYTYK